jgi:outer membrane protein TolC
MDAFRRALRACAVAGLGAAAGCTPSYLLPESNQRLQPAEPTLRVQRPTVPTPSPGIPTPPAALAAGKSPLADPNPPREPSDLPLPINLATALRLGNARPLDVQIAGRQVAAAAAAYDRARLLWVPNLLMGVDYFGHTGLQQNFAGDLPKSNRSTFMAGLGPNVVFAFSDAVYAPLAARQELRARNAAQQSVVNDSVLAVAEAYFAVQQARGDLAGALAAETKAEELVRRTVQLAKGLAPPAEENRARVELGRRKQAVAAARERWRTAGAELARLLRLDPTAVIEPAEPPTLPVTVIDPTVSIDDLIPLALNTRPELAGNQAFVQATLARLKQEKIRPLVPSLVVRGASTNPAGTLGYGVFGGGTNSLSTFGSRFDIDMQLLWEFQALGFGNKARVAERRAEYEAATLDLFRTQDRIAAEVATRYAEVRAAAQRLNDAEPALKEAIELVQKNVEGLGGTQKIGERLVLTVRPQEAVAALQAFAQANSDFFAAVTDYNRAQFRLYRALGHPAQCIAGAVPQASEASTPVPAPPPETKAPAQPLPLPVVPQVRAEPLPAGVVPVVTPAAAPELTVPKPPTPNPAQNLPIGEWKAAGPAEPQTPAEPLRPPVVVPEREGD